MDDAKQGSSMGERGANEERRFKIRISLLDRESGVSRPVTLDEAKTWDWGDPETWRMVGGWQVTSFQQFLNLLYVKMEAGVTEVEVVEAPRFTMLAGG